MFDASSHGLRLYSQARLSRRAAGCPFSLGAQPSQAKRDPAARANGEIAEVDLQHGRDSPQLDGTVLTLDLHRFAMHLAARCDRLRALVPAELGQHLRQMEELSQP